MSGPETHHTVRRLEDLRLLIGQGRFIDDLHHDAAHAVFVRSPHAHARVDRIDGRVALSMEGVLAVLTADDLSDGVATPFPVNYPNPALTAPRTPSALVREACYEGQPVAMVVATSRARGEDAAAAVNVTYQTLPAAVDLERAAANLEGPAHSDAEDCVAGRYTDSAGDVDAAMAAAAHVIERRFVCDRASGCPLEGRGIVADFDMRTGRLSITDTTQIPHPVRFLIAQAMGLALDDVDVEAPDMGGSFGTKGFPLYPEELLVPFASRHLGRRVQWIEDRAEHFRATSQARSQIHNVRVGFDADGRILALNIDFLHDMGAYAQFGLVLPLVTADGIVGPYRIDHVCVSFTAVYTNTVHVSPYRGSSTPYSTFVIERTLDAIAQHLTLDRAEVRRRNLLIPSDFPHDTGLRAAFGDGTTVYDSGDYAAGLDQVLEAIGWSDFPRRRAAATADGRRIGIGLAVYVEGSGIGPYETARVAVDPGGGIRVDVGSTNSGQGHETIFATIAAKELGVAVDQVSVTEGSTRAITSGYGSYASRTAVVGGSAVLLAAREVADRARVLGARMLGAPPDEVTLAHGLVLHPHEHERAVPLSVLATMSLLAPPMPREVPGLSATATYTPADTTYASGAHACIVEVDPDTYDLRILQYIAQHDCGEVINSLIVDGQVLGGIVHGVAEAFYERRVYDPGGHLLTDSFHEYLMPYATEVPTPQILHGATRAPGNPLGAKGAGEAGVIPVAATLISAIEDALGVPIFCTPQSPDQLFTLMSGLDGSSHELRKTALAGGSAV
jgi:CO/xanthine dehydrogenase Mo-binding subunit